MAMAVHNLMENAVHPGAVIVLAVVREPILSSPHGEKVKGWDSDVV